MALKGASLALFALLISFLLLFGCIQNGSSVSQAQPENPPEQNVSVQQPPPLNPQPESPPQDQPPEPEKKVGKTEIVRTFHYVSGNGYYHISGVVKNIGNYPLNYVEAEVTSYKKDGTKRISTPFAEPTRLAPGESGGFVVTLGQDKEFDVGKYDVTVGDFKIDNNVYEDQLEVEEELPEQSGTFYYKASAKIWNRGTKPSKNYWVNAVFYDASGNVLETGSDVIGTNGGIKPGEYQRVAYVVANPSPNLQIANFEIRVDYGTRTG